jgi:hypothetical protein
MEGQIELGSEVAAKLKIGIGFCTAQAVMQMRSVEDETEFPALFNKSAQQRDGVSAAGESDGEAHPGLQQRCVERE